MTVRPKIDEETVERMDEKLQGVMKVPPESASIDRKINILLDELSEAKKDAFNARQQANQGGTRF